MKNKENEELKQLHCSILMAEVKEKVQMLRELGMSETEIMSNFRISQPLKKMVISKNYRIYLGDERKEIHMEPLVKAVYLLFLNHPEGILFKRLPEYRKELTAIYAKLKPSGLSTKGLQSIDAVTSPLTNSINEKCARIRSVFVDLFDDQMARHYYVDGLRGETKRITLPRDLVVWE